MASHAQQTHQEELQAALDKLEGEKEKLLDEVEAKRKAIRELKGHLNKRRRTTPHVQQPTAEQQQPAPKRRKSEGAKHQSLKKSPNTVGAAGRASRSAAKSPRGQKVKPTRAAILSPTGRTLRAKVAAIPPAAETPTRPHAADDDPLGMEEPEDFVQEEQLPEPPTLPTTITVQRTSPRRGSATNNVVARLPRPAAPTNKLTKSPSRAAAAKSPSRAAKKAKQAAPAPLRSPTRAAAAKAPQTPPRAAKQAPKTPPTRSPSTRGPKVQARTTPAAAAAKAQAAKKTAPTKSPTRAAAKAKSPPPKSPTRAAAKAQATKSPTRTAAKAQAQAAPPPKSPTRAAAKKQAPKSPTRTKSPTRAAAKPQAQARTIPSRTKSPSRAAAVGIKSPAKKQGIKSPKKGIKNPAPKKDNESDDNSSSAVARYRPSDAHPAGNAKQRNQWLESIYDFLQGDPKSRRRVSVFIKEVSEKEHYKKTLIATGFDDDAFFAPVLTVSGDHAKIKQTGGTPPAAVAAAGGGKQRGARSRRTAPAASSSTLGTAEEAAKFMLQAVNSKKGLLYILPFEALPGVPRGPNLNLAEKMEEDFRPLRGPWTVPLLTTVVEGIKEMLHRKRQRA